MSGSGSGGGGGGNGKPSRYQQQLKGSKGQSYVRVQGQLERAAPKQRSGHGDKTQQRIEGDLIDAKFGFDRYTEV